MLIAKIVKKGLQFYWRRTRGLSLGVRAIVVDVDGRVLLVRPQEGSPWMLPNAEVRKGETAEDALRRMLDGTLSITLEASPDFIAVRADPASHPGGHWAIVAVRHWRQNGARDRAPIEARRFDISHLPPGLDPEDAHSIATSLALVSRR